MVCELNKIISKDDSNEISEDIFKALHPCDSVALKH